MTAALENLLRIEVQATEARRLTGRLRFANLPSPATLEDFDYEAQPGVDPALIRHLASNRYLVILIGMPGFDRQLVRYPPFYSRIGFAHHYKPLDAEDIAGVLGHYWLQLGLREEDLHPDGELVNAVVRITGGTFRLIERLMTQVGRLRDMNDFRNIIIDLIAAARHTLIVGAQ